MAAAQDPTPATTVNIIATVDGRPNPQPPSSSRRLPPPCWSHEETVALIDSYRDKWYSLRRGNLKALHWQEVADAIAHRCPLANPSKTSVQCRHKVEKLRKRYRTEKQKALSNPGRFSSSWVYFRKMEAMEKGPSSSSSAPPRSNSSDEDDDGENDDANEEDGEDDDPMPPSNNTRSLHRLLNNGVSANGDSEGGLGGFRLRIPCRATMALPAVPGFRSKGYDRVFDGSPDLNPSHNLRYMSGGSSLKSSLGRKSDGGGGSGGVKRDMDPVSDMVNSIRMFGEGFVKMEQRKIDLARELERRRMDMELKRTEMILDSQQRILEAFAKGFSGKKKIKRLLSPDS